MRVGVKRHASAALPPGKRPGTHCIGGWVDPRAGLDRCGKSRLPHRGFDPRTVQPVASEPSRPHIDGKQSTKTTVIVRSFSGARKLYFCFCLLVTMLQFVLARDWLPFRQEQFYFIF